VFTLGKVDDSIALAEVFVHKFIERGARARDVVKDYRRLCRVT